MKMAKKAVKKVDSKKDDIKKVRDSLWIDASYIKELERTLIPWSPAMDEATGGGIVSGSMITMSGQSKSGKSQSVLKLIAQCQKPEYGGRYWSPKAAEERGEKPGRPVFFMDVEGRLNHRDLISTHGLDDKRPKFNLACTTEEKTLYHEDYTTRAEKAIEKYPGCVIIFDSISALCTQKMAAVSDGGQILNNAPGLTAQFVARICPQIRARDIIMVNVQHKVANIGAIGFQARTVATGGTKIGFAANYIFDLTHSELDKGKKKEEDEEGREDDNNYFLNMLCLSSELGRPKTKSKAYLKFGYGLWDEYELAMLLTDGTSNDNFGVRKVGSNYTISKNVTEADNDIKIDGIRNFATWLEEHPAIYQKLYNAYKRTYWRTATELYG